MFVKLRFSFAAVALAAILGCSALPSAYSAPRSQAAGKDVKVDNSAVDLRLGRNVLTLWLVRDNALRVHFKPNAKTTPTALVISAHAPETAAKPVRISRHDGLVTMTSKALRAELNPETRMLSVYDVRRHRLLLRQNDLAALAHRNLDLRYTKGAPLYGIKGFNAFQHDVAGLLRHGRWVAKAGRQGNAGAPFVWSTRGFGLLIDTDGATFDLDNGHIAVRGTSRPDVDYYILAGKPKAIFSALADISGHAPLFPKWAMGFTNSQWGIDEQELLNIVKTYRSKHIPLDNFTLDYDWKAWGQGHYGEFRWNPKKFPDGPTGKLARMLDAKGVKLTGIMKPRIHIHTVEGRYATAHHFWVPGQKAYKDYFSHTLVKDIDFNKPAARAWFGHSAIKYAFDKGIVGWWNDEADDLGDNTQFLNMERGLYEAQRAQSDKRVWSINRNFWLGSQRYAYGLWSGDIHTGFATMAAQRERMLSAIDVGEMKWGMDGGGFQGHPSDQNYARWIEFGAFTPIFRVHGTHGEKRQPWRYGAVAEKAATRAIRLRYALIPYTYSYVWSGHVTGIGLVRPLIFAYPGDTQVRNDISAWMFGKWLLVSPVVKKDQTEKRIYLPRGTWTDYFTGKAYHGGRTITVPIHSKTWMTSRCLSARAPSFPPNRCWTMWASNPSTPLR
jgi:alpha-glucosidase (family GH31 glycosyl hydrolase)